MTTRLIDYLASPDNLLAAWRAVRGNIPKYRRQRSSGPDGVSLAEFEQDLTAQLAALQEMLTTGRYQPTPAKQFSMPKKSGGERTICILTVRERVAQRATQQVIEPLWEPQFLPCSFGYRPGISIEQAVACAQSLRAQGCGWIVDSDISACFDSLDHDLLMTRMQRKVDDPLVLRLLQAWLDVGVMQAGPPLDAETGAAMFQTASSLAQKGLDWVVEATTDDDPYGSYRPYSEENLAGYANAAPDAEGYAARMRRTTIRRLTTSGVMLGAGMLRPALRKLTSTAYETLNTPAGRRLLKKSALASAGLAGLAAASAVAAYLLQRKAGPAPTGVLQGSPLSPLLANIYLHPFDVTLTRRGHQLARFADDFVIGCPTREAAESAYNDAVRCLAKLRLKVNPEKTRIIRPDEPLEWLGVVIR
jgi:RNA-directed DNA polymerase